MFEVLLAVDLPADIVGSVTEPVTPGGGDLPAVPESGGFYVGAVGHLISALLQTSGLFAQSEVLSNFSSFFNSLGIFIYIYALITAMLSVAVFGNYKQALYLFLGPVLFVWILSDRVPAEGVILQFGERITEGSTLDQRRFLELVGDMGIDVPNPEISWFFALWDNTVSSIVQGTVAVLLDTKNMEDLTQAATERIYSRVLLHEGVEPGFIRLIAKGVMGECAEQSSMAQEIAKLPAGAERNRLQARLDSLRGNRLGLDYSTMEYLRTLSPTSTALSSCPNASSVMSNLSSNVRTCDEIWSFTCVVAIDEADRVLAGVGAEEAGGVSTSEIQNRVKQALAGGKSAANASRLLAAHIVKNTLRNTTQGAMTASFAGKMALNQDEYNLLYGPIAEAEAKAARFGLVFFSSMIPYIQGLLLFFLAMVFPFFAIFLLVPDRWTSFFIWMSLWVWVKCWDIGFGMIHYLKQFLWPFMQNGVSETGDVDWSTPEAVFAVIYENDPLATTNTYYQVIALLTISVPFITAHFATGARHLYRAFSGAWEQPTQQFQQRYAVNVRTRDIWSPSESAAQRAAATWALEQTRARYPGFDWDDFVKNANSAMDATVPREIQSYYMEKLYEGTFKDNGAFTRYSVATAMSNNRVDPWVFGSQRNLIAPRITEAAHQHTGRSLGDVFGPKLNSSRTKPFGTGVLPEAQDRAPTGDEGG